MVVGCRCTTICSFGLVKARSMFSGGLSVVIRSERVGEEEDWRGGILDKEI